MSKLLDQRKHAELVWLQYHNHTSAGDLRKVRLENN